MSVLVSQWVRTTLVQLGCRQQHGLYGLVAGLFDSSFWILSVYIKLCSYYCADLLFDSQP